MKRRQILLAGSALVASQLVGAQSARVYRVAMVTLAPRSAFHHLVEAFEQGLREHGYAAGRDVVVEVHSAEGNPDRHAKLVREVVGSKPDVILTSINANTTPVFAATRTIPIVMAIGTDVVGAGFVQSLSRPGGNVTGLTWDVGGETAGKRMELLKEFAPKISRVAVLWEAPYGEQFREPTDAAAAALGVRTSWLEFSGDFERDFAQIVAGRAHAVYAHHGLRLFERRKELAAIASRHHLPTACGSAEVVDAGALMSYGPNLSDLFRRAAGYADKIFKGAKPGDLPVERPTKLELVVNRNTAKALGLTLSPSLLLRVDRFVE